MQGAKPAGRKRWLTALAACAGALAVSFVAVQAAVEGNLSPLSPFALCVLLAFTLQWLAFIPAWLKQTEHFFDLIGSITFVTLVWLAVWLAGAYDLRSLVLAICVTLWAGRLGSFLWSRIRKAGEDKRFRGIRPYFPTFFMTWTLQGLWVTLTLCAALAAITAGSQVAPDIWFWLGLLAWTIGFAFEVVADRQKTAFRAEPANKNTFITTGLWGWCRHPNYFGETLCWFAIALMAAGALSGTALLLAVVSPLWVIIQLTLISGVRMLKYRGEKRWGDDSAYQDYVRRTPLLFPLPPR